MNSDSRAGTPPQPTESHGLAVASLVLGTTGFALLAAWFLVAFGRVVSPENRAWAGLGGILWHFICPGLAAAALYCGGHALRRARWLSDARGKQLAMGGMVAGGLTLGAMFLFTALARP